MSTQGHVATCARLASTETERTMRLQSDHFQQISVVVDVHTRARGRSATGRNHHRVFAHHVCPAACRLTAGFFSVFALPCASKASLTLRSASADCIPPAGTCRDTLSTARPDWVIADQGLLSFILSMVGSYAVGCVRAYKCHANVISGFPTGDACEDLSRYR